MATKKKKEAIAQRHGRSAARSPRRRIAAAAGAYLLSDKKTKAKAKNGSLKARKEVVKKAKMAKKLGEKEYGRIVEQAIKRYGSLEEHDRGRHDRRRKGAEGRMEEDPSAKRKRWQRRRAEESGRQRKSLRKAKPQESAADSKSNKQNRPYIGRILFYSYAS